jgi:ADP-heptose:LPS heptosyltransferase
MLSKRIIVSPYSRTETNAKTYPYWQELCDLIATKGYRIIQIGIEQEPKLRGCEYRYGLSLPEVEQLVKDVGLFISSDNFLHHMAHFLKVDGIVIWGPSDPLIFGYPEQGNVIKNRNSLRGDQFGFYNTGYVWEHCSEGWYSPHELIKQEEVTCRFK